MVTFNPNSICKQTRPYYYEYLCSGAREHIPTGILAHISRCHLCQAEVNRLKIELAKGEERAGQSSRLINSMAVANLRYHFAYRGRTVTCNTIRPFLPGLASGALDVGVPTPITVHLDKCQRCADDLEAIRQLNLTHQQLCRLGELFAEEASFDRNDCERARHNIASVTATVFDGVSAETLRHLSMCPDCRKLLYEARKVRRERLSGDEERSHIPYKAVAATDVFDYVVPYGIDPANDQYAMFRKSLTSHLANCPECLNKMQRLHRTVYGILEREESGIATCFRISDSAADSAGSGSGDVYEGWPIEVEVVDKSGKTATVEEQVSGSAEPAVLLGPEQRRAALRVRPFIKPAAVAAAVVLAAILFLNRPAAKAVGLEQLYKAFEHVKNVYFATFVPERPEPKQEVWVSETLNIKMIKADTGWSLLDLVNKSRKTRDLDTGSVATVALGDDVIAEVKEGFDVRRALLPFADIFAVPRDAVWQRTAEENVETVIAGTEIYDLIWAERQHSGRIAYTRWRCYIDIRTKLPKRTELWEKYPGQEDYQLMSFKIVTYPAAAEIQDVVNRAGF